MFQFAEKLKAVRKIENFILRTRERQEGAVLRCKLKTLPYPCRASFVKMHDLKAKTQLFRNQADKFRSTNVLF